jgi:Cd2+/Zn2+-exporting ATPase
VGLPVEDKTTEQIRSAPQGGSSQSSFASSPNPVGSPAPEGDVDGELRLVAAIRPLAAVLTLTVIAALLPSLIPAGQANTLLVLVALAAAVVGVGQVVFTLATSPWQRAPHLLSVVTASFGVAVAVWVLKLPAEIISAATIGSSIELAGFCSALLLWHSVRQIATLRLTHAAAFPLSSIVATAWRRETPDDLEKKVSPQTLTRGTFFVCRAGDTVPADAVVLSGGAVIHERILSGAVSARIRGQDEEVYAGSKVLKGEITAQVTSELRDSKITSFLDLLGNATNPSEVLFYRLSGPWLWALPFVAACVALGWHEVMGRWDFPLGAAGAVLACVALLDLVRLMDFVPGVAIRTAFDRGVLFHNRAALERCGRPKEVVLEQSSEEPLFGLYLREFTLLDERIDRARMESALLAIFGRVGTEYAEAFERRLQTRAFNLHPCGIREYHEYSSMGVAAVVEGAEFSVGSEEFLVARGVRIQPTEISSQKAGELVMYIAIGDELVARCIFAEPALDRLGERLFKQDAELRLLGTIPAESLDRIAKRVGVELALTAGGLTVGEIKERVRALRHPVLFAGARTDPQIISAAEVAVSIFDPIRWDIERTSVTLFSSGIEALESCLATARKGVQVYQRSRWFTFALAALLLPLTVAGYVPAAVVLLAVLTGITFILMLAEGFSVVS